MSSRSSPSEICRRSQTSAIGRRSPARPAWIRIEASVTSRAKRSGRIAVSGAAAGVAVAVVGAGRRRRRVDVVLDARRRRACGARSAARGGAPARSPAPAGARTVRVLAEPEHPRDQLALVGVLGHEQAVGAALDLADLAVAAEVALEQPGDALGDADLGACRRARRTARPRGWRRRAGRSRRGGGSRARPWSRRRPCRGCARGGTRAGPRARGRSPANRTGRPGRAGGRGRRCAGRARRAPS